MQVWLLEYYCSDTNSMDFESLFETAEKAIEYVETHYPDAYVREVDSKGNIQFYSERYYAKDQYNQQSEFTISLTEVR